MPQFLDTTAPDFEARFAAFPAARREADAEVDAEIAAAIAEVDAEIAATIAEVAARGDAAVIAMTERWDRQRLTPATLAFAVVGGPNHVLPTARSTRFSSGLSVLDFIKRAMVARMAPAAHRAIGPAAARLAAAEGLEAHGLSVLARLERRNQG